MPIRGSVGSVLVAMWVLLQPPVDRAGRVLTDAALEDWVVNGRFATKALCVDNQSKSEAAVAFAMSQDGAPVGQAADVVLKARCIELEELKKLLRSPASDDFLD